MAKNDPIVRTDEEINQAVRVLLDAEYLLNGEQTLMLAASKEHSVYIIPEVMDENSAEENPELLGQIDYMVSDGPSGSRSTGLSTYTYREAMELFKKICDEGWVKGSS